MTTCFGTYAADLTSTCRACSAKNRCKAILITDGWSILSDIIDHLMTELPPQARFLDTERPAEQLKQLLNPPALTDQEAENLKAGFPSTQPIPDDLQID